MLVVLLVKLILQQLKTEVDKIDTDKLKKHLLTWLN